MTDPPSPTSVSTNLSVPEWVPAVVAVQAEDLLSSLVMPGDDFRDFASAVGRFATNPLMETVWKELSRRSGGVAALHGAYAHPAHPDAVLGARTTASARLLIQGLPDRDKIQHQAMVDLFAEAALFFTWKQIDIVGPRTRTKADLDDEVRRLKKLASRLRTDAEELRKLGEARLAMPVGRAADFCDMQADWSRPRQDDSFLVSRQSNRLGGPWVQGFIINTAGCCRALFGKKMLGVVAIMANVAFERTDLTEDRIRGIFRPTPGVKGRRTAR
jgi:hypothetical protein